MTAVLLGLEGHLPETLETDQMELRVAAMRATGRIAFGGSREIALTEADMILRPLTILPFHPNGMTVTAFGPDSIELHRETYFSVGGGFVVTEAESREPARSSTAAHALRIRLGQGDARTLQPTQLQRQRSHALHRT